MASERPDKGDLYQQAGREMAERHEREHKNQLEEIRKQREDMKRTLQFEAEEHCARMMRLKEEEFDHVIESLEKKQREEQTGEREAPEVSRAKDELERQARKDREQEKEAEERAFAADREQINEAIDRLVEVSERKEAEVRRFAEKRGIDPKEAVRSHRREYENKIRQWENHREEWTEKSVEERNRLLERLDREMKRDRDRQDQGRSSDRDRTW
jgi:hypothetical protein